MFRWLQRSSAPEFAKTYREHTRGKTDRKTPFPELRFVALDAETTGFNVEKDRLLSIGLVPIQDGALQVGQRRNWLVQQNDLPLNEAVKIHGISPAESANGKPEAEVLQEMIEEIGGAIIVGHHIGFDSEVIGRAMRRHFGFRLRNRLIDTAMLSMRHLDPFHKTGYANQRPPGLDEVCQHAGLPVMGRHTASGDAFTTGQLFLWICGRMRVRNGRELVAGDLLK